MLPYLLLMFLGTFFSAISQVLLKQSAGKTYKSVIYEYLNWRVIVAYGISFSTLLLILFSGNLIKHPCFDQIRGTDAYRVSGDLTNTDFIMNNTFWIGVYPGMTDEMIDYMARIIIEAVNQ